MEGFIAKIHKFTKIERLILSNEKKCGVQIKKKKQEEKQKTAASYPLFWRF